MRNCLKFFVKLRKMWEGEHRYHIRNSVALRRRILGLWRLDWGGIILERCGANVKRAKIVETFETVAEVGESFVKPREKWKVNIVTIPGIVSLFVGQFWDCEGWVGSGIIWNVMVQMLKDRRSSRRSKSLPKSARASSRSWTHLRTNSRPILTYSASLWTVTV